MRLFDIAEWMRITYMEYSTFCVELKGKFKTHCHDRRQALIDFILQQRRFESYYINDTKYDNCGEIVERRHGRQNLAETRQAGTRRPAIYWLAVGARQWLGQRALK